MSNKNHRFSFQRCFAIMLKEFLQMRRDRLTFGMVIGLPILQLILFGFAINMNPKHLPTAVISSDQSPYTRIFTQSLVNTSYFKINPKIITSQQAEQALAQGKLSFIITVPVNFYRDLIRGDKPQLLVESDATDPSASSNATVVIHTLAHQVFDPLANGSTDNVHSTPAAFNLITHAKYNPQAITQYNIVPGLLGVILTMTLVMITSMGITREKERGTMETLLSMPVNPLEVSIGKVTPYIVVGYLQFALILTAAIFLFNVPMQGSLSSLILATLPFILPILLWDLLSLALRKLNCKPCK
jgi:ABC-2 type transport system permease protein